MTEAPAPARRLFHVGDDGQRREVDPQRIDDLAGGWTWLDVVDPDEAHTHALAERFGLHRTTREDLLEQQIPKFDDLGRYRVFVVHALAPDPTAIRTVEVDVVVGDDWVVTVHAEPVRSIEVLTDRIHRADFTLDGPFHLACRLFELVGERYLPILDDVDTQVLDLEEGAVEGIPTVLPDIHALRRDIAVLRRSLAPQRRMLETLARSRSERSDPAGRDLADAVDHHVHMVESLDSAHQMVATLVDTYRSATAERLNEVMKVLTVFSAIFLPLTLVAGIYGMNFVFMPELDERWGYPAALGTMAVVGVGLWLYFVRRGFIGGPKLRSVLGPARVAGRVGRGLAAAAVLPVRVATRKLNGDDE
ncbi:MAG: magnesium/cobalt transporter CorA [Acidimicrobiia bacterium]